MVLFESVAPHMYDMYLFCRECVAAVKMGKFCNFSLSRHNMTGDDVYLFRLFICTFRAYEMASKVHYVVAS